MLKAVGIANFKAYGADMQRVPLGRVTVLLGPNSGGKSSISHALLVLRQGLLNDDWDCRDRNFMRTFGLDLGGFTSFVHRHEITRHVEWMLEFQDVGEEIAVRLAAGLPRSCGLASDRATLTRFSVEIGGREVAAFELGLPHNGSVGRLTRAEAERGLLLLRRLDVQHPAIMPDLDGAGLARGASLDFDARLVDDQRELARIADSAKDFDKRRPQVLEAVSRHLVQHLATDPSAWREFDLRAPQLEGDKLAWDADPLGNQLLHLTQENLLMTLERVAQMVESQLKSMDYLRAARLLMDRDGQISESALQAQVESEQALVNRLAGEPEALLEVNDFLASDPGMASKYQLVKSYAMELNETEFALDDDALGKRVRELQQHLETGARLRLLDQRSGTLVSFHDVGSGVMSMLRQLVFGCRSRDRFLMVEEPDASHHPMVQARLADIYLQLAQRRGNCFLLETHSPYIVQGLLKRVKRTFHREETDATLQLRAEDVSIVYVLPEDDGSQMRTIRISDDGFLTDQIPDGFLSRQSELRFG